MQNSKKHFRPKIFEFSENINLVFKKCWPIVKRVLTISKLLIQLYFVMSAILIQKHIKSLVRKSSSVISGISSADSLSLWILVFPQDILWESIVDHVFSGVNFKKELPNEGLIKASKCKTCEVEDGSIRTDPETGEERKVKLERCAKCRMVWYCGKECQQQNWPYHKPNCTKSTVGVGLPVFIKVRKVTDRETLVNTIKNASRFTIDYKWDEDSISTNKESYPDPEPFEIDPYNMVSSIKSNI